MTQLAGRNSRKLRRPTRITLLILAGLLVFYLVLQEPDSDFQLWHLVQLEQEFSREKLDEIQSFDDYLRLEARLFLEMEEKIISRTAQGPGSELVRYSSGSLASPARFSPNWNMSFEMEVEHPVGGVLLLHGMSDSPYSLRELALTLHRRNFHVVGLRLPGHGTIPSGLKHIDWEDMAAAVQLAAAHLSDKVGQRPLHLIGYSTGAALALHQTLDMMAAGSEPLPASLILISPAIGIHPAARLAGVKNWLARLPGLDRLAWLSIEPEFDPFKYNSFATNAGTQVDRLTRALARRIAELAQKGEVERFPPILVCKSAVDATVSNRAVADNLLRPLGDHGHQLLLFDINRVAAKSPMLTPAQADLAVALLTDETLPTTVDLLTNRSPESRAVQLLRSAPYSSDITETSMINSSWPEEVFSLSHVALPFSPDDPLYGAQPPADHEHLYLGQIPLQGERGLLKIPADYFIRLRHNPFYPVLEARALDWVITHAN